MVSGNQKILWEKRNAEGLCAYCGKETATSGKGKWKWCEPCHQKQKDREKAYYHQPGGRERQIAKTRMLRSDRKSKGLCVYCGKPANGKRWCTTCRERQVETRRRNGSDFTWRENTKHKAMEFYGSKCGRCGFDDVRILHFHHINHDGTEDRKRLTGKVGGGAVLATHRDILKNGYRPDLELLCPNCHALTHWLEGRSGYRPNNKGMTTARHKFRYLDKT